MMKRVILASFETKNALQVLAAAFSLAACSIPAHAGPVEVVPPQRKDDVVVLGQPQLQSAYDQLRANSRATRVETWDQINSNYPALAGRTVEMNGLVSGVMTTSQGKRVVVKIAARSVPFDISDALARDAETMRALRPGANVRLLANVNPQPVEPMVTLLAATDKILPEPLFRDQEDDNGVIIVPPMVSSGLPIPLREAPPTRPRNTATIQQQLESQQRAPQTQASRRQASRGTARPTSGIGAMAPEADDNVQTAAYKALALRFNPKLSQTQADEISRALLGAGYEQNMDPRFLAAIIAVESDFDIRCLSSSGAMGLGQLMPFNIPEAGLKYKSDAWDPTKNIFGTARLLRGHLNDFGKRPDGTLLAVAAYNAGPNAVKRAGYKVPNGAQVQRYVWKVYYRYKEFAPELFQ